MVAGLPARTARSAPTGAPRPDRDHAAATLARTPADADLAEALRRRRRRRTATLDSILTAGGSSPEVNGWRLTMHVFDYNLDYFEVGALDDPQFKITDPKVRIVERAAAAQGRPVGQPRLRGRRTS